MPSMRLHERCLVPSGGWGGDRTGGLQRNWWVSANWQAKLVGVRKLASANWQKRWVSANWHANWQKRWVSANWKSRRNWPHGSWWVSANWKKGRNWPNNEARPDDVSGRIYEHARHFCDYVKLRLCDYHRQTGRFGQVVATFDAELFGHWWFEGPQFLRDVVLTLNADPDVELLTAEQALQQHRPDKMVSMPQGSWGEGGDHRVWSNPQINWMWDIEYRCEADFGKATFELPWETNDQIARLLKKAGRELLLLQSSDWPFAITRGQAIDYGVKRFMQHVARFETLLELAQKLAGDSAYLGKLNEIEQFEIKDAEIHDVIFADIDLDWWRM